MKTIMPIAKIMPRAPVTMRMMAHRGKDFLLGKSSTRSPFVNPILSFSKSNTI